MGSSSNAKISATAPSRIRACSGVNVTSCLCVYVKPDAALSSRPRSSSASISPSVSRSPPSLDARGPMLRPSVICCSIASGFACTTPLVRAHESLALEVLGLKRRFRPRSPAMALHLTDSLWSVRDLLHHPVPQVNKHVETKNTPLSTGCSGKYRLFFTPLVAFWADEYLFLLRLDGKSTA